MALGAVALLVGGAPVAAAETGSSSLSGGGSSSLSGNGGAKPSYEQWIADVTAVTAEAGTYLAGRLPTATRPAIVFDIDNTTLETTYHPGVLQPAIPPMLALATWAKQQGAALFFVTGRPALAGPYTRVDLEVAGYSVDGLYGSPITTLSAGAAGLQEYKTASRIDIERQGYTIVANIGNSASDLAGGHAERTFKLPDYDGALN